MKNGNGSATEHEFGTNIKTGLSEQEALLRFRRDGPNELPVGKQETWLLIFIRQFESPLIYILIFAATIIFFVGQQKLDAFIISGVLMFNAIIGTIQEGRTSNIVASLRRFIKTKSIVVRGGKNLIVDDRDLVVGDIVILKEGERIPADSQVVEAHNLHVDESILTGESTPVEKTYQNCEKQEQTQCRVFKGTYIISGSGKAIVTAIGKNTEIGKLHHSIEEINTDIPLKRELTRLSYVILLFILVICITLFVIGLVTGRPVRELLVMLTALFICVIPEGLPVVLTLVLVTGAYRMARQNVLIRNLQGVEALGRTDVIVIDKTGTLTRNEMMVTTLFVNDRHHTVTGEGYFEKGDILYENKPVTLDRNSHLWNIGVAARLLNTAELSFNQQAQLFDIKGDPTEAALLVLSQKMDIPDSVQEEYQHIFEIPFESSRKYHAAFYRYQGRGVAFIIGAPEVIFSRCVGGDKASHELEKLLEQGLRVVAVGMKTFDLSQSSSKEEYESLLKNGITLLGICGIQDAIRPEVKDMVAQARAAGLRIIMATGDHKKTALYVASEVGIYREGDRELDSSDFAKMTDDELLSVMDTVTVCARVSPQDKVRIINVLHKKGLIVAMTGDGVNDVPSLLAADLGIAMGRIGTEVTKQAADLILLDDSFVNIIRAIEQGRHIFYTLRRIVLYFFATNMGEILIVLFALFTNLPLPLTAAQILWLNFVTDGFLDVGLSMEPQEPDLLQAQWLKKKVRLVDASLLAKTIYLAIPMGIASLGVFICAYDGTPATVPYARTMALVSMGMFQWFNAWNCRSEEKSLWELGLFSNQWLIVTTLFVLLLQIILVYLPPMQFIFKTVPLSIYDWGTIVMLSAPIVVLEEVRKFIVRMWYR